MSGEQWRRIPGYEGRYDVSDQGRIRSWLPWNGAPVPRLKTFTVSADGYLLVGLRSATRQKTHSVHRIVAEVFLGPCPDGMEVRHLDGNPGNAQLSNLAYGTPSQNAGDRVRHGSDRNARKTHCIRGHRFDSENTYITRQGIRQCRACRGIRRQIAQGAAA